MHPTEKTRSGVRKILNKNECSQEKSYSYNLQVCLKLEILTGLLNNKIRLGVAIDVRHMVLHIDEISLFKSIQQLGRISPEISTEFRRLNFRIFIYVVPIWWSFSFRWGGLLSDLKVGTLRSLVLQSFKCEYNTTAG